MYKIEKPYILSVAEIIYQEIVKIKKKIRSILIIKLLKILLDLRNIKKLVVEDFTITG